MDFKFMTHIQKIRDLLMNKSFILKNKTEWDKLVLKVAPYLSPSDRETFYKLLVKKGKDEFPAYIRFIGNKGISHTFSFDGWSEEKNYTKYNNPRFIERIDDITPYLELL